MDEMTQQNAALVEEASAATEALTEQAQSLAQLVAFFELGRGVVRSTPAVATLAPRRGSASQSRSAARRPALARAAASMAVADAAPVDSGSDPEWEKF
jgi:methyl-accepting chemotaxis protein